MNNFRIIISLLCLSFFSVEGEAQLRHPGLSYLPIDSLQGYVGKTVEEKAEKAKVVVEGTIISVSGFFDSKGHLFSSCLLSLSKVFKGEVKDSVIELITDGGIAPSGPDQGTDQPSLWGIPGGQGIFFLRPNTTDIKSGKTYESFFFMSPSSMLHYPLQQAYYENDAQPITTGNVECITTNNSGYVYDIKGELYPLISSSAGQPYKMFHPIYYDTAKTSKIDPKSYKGAIPLSDKVSSLRHISLEDRVGMADLIIEGEVISTSSFTGSEKNIFTSAAVRVSKIFKGEINDTIIEIITDGFESQNGYKLTSHWGLLYKGQRGLFYLRNNNSTLRSGKALKSYFYVYDYSFRLYNYLPKSFDYDLNIYRPIEAITGIKRKSISNRQVQQK
jgi:hypothetical protein